MWWPHSHAPPSEESTPETRRPGRGTRSATSSKTPRRPRQRRLEPGGAWWGGMGWKNPHLPMMPNVWNIWKRHAFCTNKKRGMGLDGWNFCSQFLEAKLLFKGDVFLVDYPTNRKIHSKNHWNMLRGGIFCRWKGELGTWKMNFHEPGNRTGWGEGGWMIDISDEMYGHLSYMKTKQINVESPRKNS